MRTQNINGYKWLTIEAFNDDNAICDAFFGLPMGNTTTTMDAKISYTDQEGIDFYYVGCQEQLTEVLGAPSNFDIKLLD